LCPFAGKVVGTFWKFFVPSTSFEAKHKSYHNSIGIISSIVTERIAKVTVKNGCCGRCICGY
jgi:hypothetical protein